jgi:predicted dehydrogenase
MVPSDVDDAFVSLLEFENGALGTLEASRFSQGHKNYNCFEINGEKGSIQFNLERLNELNVFWAGEDPKETRLPQCADQRGLPSHGQLAAHGHMLG